MAVKLSLEVFAKAEGSSALTLQAPPPSIPVFPVRLKAWMELSSSSLFSFLVHPGPSQSLTLPC